MYNVGLAKDGLNSNREAPLFFDLIREVQDKPLNYAAAVLAISMYIPLCIGILKGGVRQNLVTFILWGLFDAIAAIAAFLEGGNWQLPAFYVTGCLAVIATIWRTKTFSIGWVEYFFGGLVLICAVVWFFMSNEAAIVVATLALLLASVPQLKDTWLRPHEAPIWIYLGFTTANILSTLAGKDWSIAERLYPASCSLATIAFVLLAARKLLPGRTVTVP